MKKKLLFLATLAVAVAVTMGMLCSKNSVKASNDNKDNDLISYKITIPADYMASTNIAEMTLHYSVDGWNETKDADMYVTSGPKNHGIPSSYAYNAVVKVRKGTTIDYCYKVTYKNATTKWINNDGKNYQVVANESNVKKIQYEIDWLAGSNGVDANGDVVLYYGINGWNNVQDVKMDVKMKSDYDGQTWYKAVITVDEGSTINYCVKANTDKGEKWDNNNGKDYFVIANQDCNN